MSRSCGRRVQQGDLIAVAAGTLSLNAQGRIDGELQMTVAGIEKVIPALGHRKDAGGRRAAGHARSRGARA